MKNIEIFIDYVAYIVETLGVLTIFLGIIFALSKYIYFSKKEKSYTYNHLRQSIGKAILLGLEILIAADIMATVVTEPNLKSVSVLALIVLIRIILSLSLQVELEGKFPWQADKEKT